MNSSLRRTVKLRAPSKSAENLLVMLLFLSFACCALALVLTGARVYGTINDTSVQNHELRGTVAYIVNRLRAADSAENVIELTKDGDSPVISIRESIGGGEYTTYIYVYDGTLRELFIDSSFTYEQGDGESIAEIGSLGCEYSGGMLTLRAADASGGSFSASVAMRAASVTGEGAQ